MKTASNILGFILCITMTVIVAIGVYGAIVNLFFNE